MARQQNAGHPVRRWALAASAILSACGALLLGWQPAVKAQIQSLVSQQTCGMPGYLAARGWPTELTPNSAQEPTALAPGSVTLAVLPDTQYYVACRSSHFTQQVQWLSQVATQRNLKAVLTLGDLTENNVPSEWEFIQAPFAGLEQQVPTVLVTGNHDHGDSGQANRRGSLFQHYFPPPTAGATATALAEMQRPGDRENAYYRIQLPAVTLGVLALEWSPRSATVAWANSVLTRYATDRVIVVTHAYLYHDGTRYDWWAKGERQEWNPLRYATAKRSAGQATTERNLAAEGALDGEQLWQQLISQHASVFLTLNGHVLDDGTAVATSTGRAGNQVQQVLVNYQMLREGGLGYLRLLELLADGKTLRMKTYSPSLQRFATGAAHNTDLSIDPPLWTAAAGQAAPVTQPAPSAQAAPVTQPARP